MNLGFSTFSLRGCLKRYNGCLNRPFGSLILGLKASHFAGFRRPIAAHLALLKYSSIALLGAKPPY
jgi:hypothetical protein